MYSGEIMLLRSPISITYRGQGSKSASPMYLACLIHVFMKDASVFKVCSGGRLKSMQDVKEAGGREYICGLITDAKQSSISAHLFDLEFREFGGKMLT